MSPTRNWRNHPAWAKTLSILAHCWAHCRRQFFDIAKPGPAPIAQEALQRIAKLYEIEAEIRGLSAADRRAARRTKPLLEAMKLWFEQRAAELPRKSSLAEAVGYALNQWDGLVRFLDDGRIEIDSNTVERSIRPIALNRKNALFAGHDLGAENWAVNRSSQIRAIKPRESGLDRGVFYA
jgi:transposase